MSRYRIQVTEESGCARVVLMDRGVVIGSAAMSWHEYTTLARDIVRGLVKATGHVVEKTLSERLWIDAQAMFDNSPELAKIKLLEFGWTSEKIAAYAKAIAAEIGKMLVDMMPEGG